MHRKLLLPIGAALLLAGCAAIDQLERQMSGGVAVDRQLVFLDRLNEASGEELDAIGERLQAGDTAAGTRQPFDALRYALWQSTPGHAGYAPAEAEKRLEGLLADGRPPRALQALIRVQLRHLSHLRGRDTLERKNAQLESANGAQQQEIRALQEKIKALTTLERRMGAGDDEGSGQP